MTNWHLRHSSERSFGDVAADRVATFMGSWKFIILQTVLVVLWMTANIIGFVYHWDEYPFILLNLLFSTQAAYAAPIIMQSQNRQSERDRHHAEADYRVNLQSKNEIEAMTLMLSRIENEKLDKVIRLLETESAVRNGQ